MQLKGIEDNFLVGFVKLQRRDFINTPFMHEKKDDILKNIDEIKNIKIEEKESLNKDIELTRDNPWYNIISEKKVIIDKDCIERFKEFLELYHIDIDEFQFFYLGNLVEERTPFGSGDFGAYPSYNYKGTDKEKKKNELLEETIVKIEEYLEYKEYFEKMSNFYYFEMALSNVGETYDEDIDIKFFIRKGLLIKPEDLPIPKDYILDKANNWIDFLYKSKISHNLNEYPNYPNYLPPISFYEKDYKEELHLKKGDYKVRIDRLFCYDFFENEEFDIVLYNQSYIKQNTNFLLPSLIYIKDKPLEIKYEIRSKHFPDVMTGTLKVEF